MLHFQHIWNLVLLPEALKPGMPTGQIKGLMARGGKLRPLHDTVISFGDGLEECVLRPAFESLG